MSRALLLIALLALALLPATAQPSKIQLGNLSTTSATSGKAVTFNGSSIVWGNPVPAAHTQPSSTISDSTAAGRALLTAADELDQAALLPIFDQSNRGMVPASSGSSTEFLRGDGVFAAPTAAAVPSGSSGSVQYNNAGVSAGAAKTSINANGSLQLALDSSPIAPPADTVSVFARKVGGRMMIAQKGPSGLDTSLQPYLARNRVMRVAPYGNSTTITLDGISVGTNGGALTAANFATTNLHTSMRRVDSLVTTAAVNAVAGFRGTVSNFWRGNAARLGGFTYVLRWAPAIGASTATSRCFAGLRNSTVNATDVEPSTQTDTLGVGFDAADANLQAMQNNNTGAAVKTDLGASFAVPTTDRAKVYELAIFAAPNASSITYEFTDLITNAVATGTFSTDIPSNVTGLNPYMYCSSGGTSSVIGMTLFSLYIETDY
jgi:hypothetical protein